MGVAIKPLPNTKNPVELGDPAREIRYDYSDKPVFASGEHHQLTFSVDAPLHL